MKTKPSKKTNGIEEITITMLAKKTMFEVTKYRLEKPFTLAGVDVPKGFKSDGATIPRWVCLIGWVVCLGCYIAVTLNPTVLFIILSSILFVFGTTIICIPIIFPRIGKYVKGAFVHDYHLEEIAPTPTYENRKKADKVFLDSLRELNIHKARMYPMFWAVRIFGILKVSILILFKKA